MDPPSMNTLGPTIAPPQVREFLGSVAPFDSLEREELERLASRVEIAFFPKGQRIVNRGAPAYEYLYIVQQGAARVSLMDEAGKELLVDIRGEGDYFGASSLLEHKPAMFDISAEEDLIALMIPADELQRLVKNHPIFKRFFSFSMARTVQAIRQSWAFRTHHPLAECAFNLDVFMSGKRVSDLMQKKVLTCPPDVSVRTAARLMTERGVSSVVVSGNGLHPLGIITDNDLRAKVLAANLSPEAPVTDIMSHPVKTIPPDAYAFDALLSMSHHGVRLLVVMGDDRMVGIISEHDLQMESGSSPVQVIGEIERANSLDSLTTMRPKIDRVLEMMLRQGGPVKHLVAMVTELNDRLALRILNLAEERMEQDGFGKPPAPYSWIAFGSEGRREQTLHTDQDNALFFAASEGQAESILKEWFLKFAEIVVESLVLSGIPRCPGGIMASNPKWCQSEEWWQERYLGWITEPNPETLLMAAIFFDFRPIYTGTQFPYVLQNRLLESVRRHKLFIRHMAHVALYNRPPLSLLKRFVVEKSGEHKNKMDLKRKGLSPVVDAARLLSLDLGIRAQNTLDRLAEIRQKGVLDHGLYADLCEAYEFIVYLQISNHLDALAKGEEPDNFLNPEDLNNLQRKMLRESFTVISRLQELIEFHYHTKVVGI
ncbi:MAG: cyclic nucleotide-binding/CBS domain-containing protein [Deltaproteobacteria bacterium]|nr:cyclic nucleotide-binding/CBS domain-containing protein [Deltaproteobacteria bacterium]MBW2136012.1 cyclic nucleotide-binding/CBS domain-containing protein [Deltaproteobacteria bacterium]